MRFRLTIPPDAQFVVAVRQVADRVAQCSGYSAADAERFASSVGRAVEQVLERASADGAALDIRFERDATHLDVWLRYRAADADRAGADAALSRETPQPGPEGVEMGREGEFSYWRLRRPLPHEKVDHQCELPPDQR